MSAEPNSGIQTGPAAARRLRIAMVGQKGIPPLHGGIERHVDEVARRLARRGHQVDVFNRIYHPHGSGLYEGVHLRRRLSVPTKHLDAGTHTALCVLECIGSRRYDLLHLHGIGPGIFVGLSRLFLPTVFTLHAQDWRQRKWGRAARWWLRRGESVAVRRAHAVIAVSDLLAHYVQETYGRAAHHIPNGAALGPAADPAPLAQWNLAPGQYVLFVGRLIEDRGLEILLAAHAQLPEAPPLVITGDVQHDRGTAEAWRTLAGPRVVFTGYQTGASLDALYSHATLCVHPSEVEGLPIAVLEAMGHGRAVLVSDIPENLEAIGGCGATFPVRDGGALRGALAGLLADPCRRADLGRRARDRVQICFDWDVIAARTEQVYHSIVP
jgi:glycosyltransferase involved in cell wall biosynthesis